MAICFHILIAHSVKTIVYRLLTEWRVAPLKDIYLDGPCSYDEFEWLITSYNPWTSISYTRLEALVTTYGTPWPIQVQLSSVQNHVPSLKIGWLIPD